MCVNKQSKKIKKNKKKAISSLLDCEDEKKFKENFMHDNLNSFYQICGQIRENSEFEG